MADQHPIDGATGELNELSLLFALRGQHEIGIKIARAVETIQAWAVTMPDAVELKALRTKAKAGELDEDRWEWIERNQIRGHISRKVVEITRQSIDDAMKVPQ